jgi:hypothetical protein
MRRLTALADQTAEVQEAQREDRQAIAAHRLSCRHFFFVQPLHSYKHFSNDPASK